MKRWWQLGGARVVSRWLSRRGRARRQPEPEPGLLRSPWWLRYGWALTLTGLVLSQLLLDCEQPLSEPVRILLQAAGLDRVSCAGDDSGRAQRKAD